MDNQIEELQKASKELRDQLANIEDFHYYCLKVLMPHLDFTQVTVPDFHWDIYKNLDKDYTGQLRGVLIVAPVGFSKSTILKIWAVYQFLWRKDPYILYVSSTIGKAKQQFGAIKKLINNPSFQAAFEYTVIRSNDDKISVLWGDNTMSMVDAIGADEGISGINFDAQRPSLIVIDDLEEIKQAQNSGITDNLEFWFNTTLISRLPPVPDQGRIRMIGTVLTKDSLTNRMLGRSQTYSRKAFQHWYTKIYQALDENDQSIWESVQPTAYLHELRDTLPESFAANYMNEPLDNVIVGAYYQRQIDTCVKEGRYGDCKFDNTKMVDTWWDEATSSDLIAVWFTQKRDDGGINFIDYWEGTGLATDEIAAIIHGKPYAYSAHYGPWDLMHKQKGEDTIRSKFEMYRNSGINFNVVGRSSVESGRNAVMVLFKWFHFAANPNVAKGFNHIRSYRSKLIPNTEGLTKEVHDVHSHCCDALRLLSVKISMITKDPSNPQRTTLNKLIEIRKRSYESA